MDNVPNPYLVSTYEKYYITHYPYSFTTMSVCLLPSSFHIMIIPLFLGYQQSDILFSMLYPIVFNTILITCNTNAITHTSSPSKPT